jgi:hypothetical protein
MGRERRGRTYVGSAELVERSVRRSRDAEVEVCIVD